jgi:hypothetical protein
VAGFHADSGRLGDRDSGRDTIGGFLMITSTGSDSPLVTRWRCARAASNDLVRGGADGFGDFRGVRQLPRAVRIGRDSEDRGQRHGSALRVCQDSFVVGEPRPRREPRWLDFHGEGAAVEGDAFLRADRLVVSSHWTPVTGAGPGDGSVPRPESRGGSRPAPARRGASGP